jgi:xylulokinase
MPLFIGHDLGTHGNKAALVDADGNVLATATASFGVDYPAHDRAEQNPAVWWNAVCECTRALLARAERSADDIAGIAFAGQMLALVAVDRNGVPTRPAISWLDARAGAEAAALSRRFGGATIVRMLAGAEATAKDIVPKVAWLRTNEPDVFARTAAFTDATGYLVARATGRVVIDPTGAAATGLIDGNTRRWSPILARVAGYGLDRAATIVECTERVGTLRPEAAAELGLRESTPVVAGLADIPAAAVGSGAVRPGDAHIYLGTSGWFAATLDKARHVPRAGIVAVAAAAPGTHLLIGENETAGACVTWLAREVGPGVVRDDIDLFEALDQLALASQPGAGGLLFAPWMFGERSPVPDPTMRAALIGLSLEHTRGDVVRAFYEGVALNLAWTRDESKAAGVNPQSVRAIGGGAQSRVWLQAVADALGIPVEVVAHPQHAGAIGAGLIAAVGAGAVPSVTQIRSRIHVESTLQPNARAHARYTELGAVLRELRPALSRASASLARLRSESGAAAHSGAAKKA